jgi:hypothetical protein
MPTALVIDGFRIVIYTNDHAPAHVHAVRGDGEAKINIANERVALVSAFGLKKSEIKRAVRIVSANRQSLLQKWIEAHGSVN